MSRRCVKVRLLFFKIRRVLKKCSHLSVLANQITTQATSNRLSVTVKGLCSSSSNILDQQVAVVQNSKQFTCAGITQGICLIAAINVSMVHVSYAQYISTYQQLITSRTVASTSSDSYPSIVYLFKYRFDELNLTTK